MSILDKTASELNALSKAQILALISEEQAAKKAEERISKVISDSGDRRGQLEQTWETRDGNGKLIGTSQTTWTYWPAGNVRDITTVVKDAEGKEISRQVVKHAENRKLAIE